MSPSASNSGECSSSPIRISAAALPAIPVGKLRAPQAPAPHRATARLVQGMDGITLGSRFMARAERRNPPRRADGSARRLRGHRSMVRVRATGAIQADKRFGSARRSSSSGATHRHTRRRGVPPAEAEPPLGAAAAADRRAAPAAAVAEQPMRAAAGMEAADTVKYRI